MWLQRKMTPAPPLTRQQIDSLKRTSLDALRRQDHARARQALQQVISAGAADGQIWYAMTHACLNLGDHAGAHDAVDQILRREPTNPQALIAKADIYVAQNDNRAAMSYFEEAVQVAGPPERLPAHIATEVLRAATAAEKAAGEMLTHLKTQLVAAGYDETNSSKRFRNSLELLAGARQRYLEEPRVFYFDGLPARGFYEVAEFDWAPALEAAANNIAEELAAFDSEDPFEPYIAGSANRPDRKHRLLDNKDWGALYLWREGVREEKTAQRFPKTMAALGNVPLDIVDGRAPMALFSRLAPKTRIDPHTGFLNTRLICHLPIVVPTGCGLRVGADTHEWRPGKLCIFNDTIEHEAWNKSSEERVILLFSIWRPELTEEERTLIGALLQSVESFSGGD